MLDVVTMKPTSNDDLSTFPILILNGLDSNVQWVVVSESPLRQ